MLRRLEGESRVSAVTEDQELELKLIMIFSCQDIMTGCLHSEGENISKLEKADILGKNI